MKLLGFIAHIQIYTLLTHHSPACKSISIFQMMFLCSLHGKNMDKRNCQTIDYRRSPSVSRQVRFMAFCDMSFLCRLEFVEIVGSLAGGSLCMRLYGTALAYILYRTKLDYAGDQVLRVSSVSFRYFEEVQSGSRFGSKHIQ